MEEAHHSAEFVKLAKELRQVSNRTLVARLRCHRAHRLRDIKLKEEEIDLQVQLFFKDDEGKKLLLRDMNEILRKDKSIGLFASGAQKKGQSSSHAAAPKLKELNLYPTAAQEQAAKEYLAKKTEKAVDVVKADYVTQMVALKKHNHHTKVKIEKMIGDRQSLINSWTWQEQMDEASGRNYFVGSKSAESDLRRHVRTTAQPHHLIHLTSTKTTLRSAWPSDSRHGKNRFQIRGTSAVNAAGDMLLR